MHPHPESKFTFQTLFSWRDKYTERTNKWSLKRPKKKKSWKLVSIKTNGDKTNKNHQIQTEEKSYHRWWEPEQEPTTEHEQRRRKQRRKGKRKTQEHQCQP